MRGVPDLAAIASHHSSRSTTLPKIVLAWSTHCAADFDTQRPCQTSSGRVELSKASQLLDGDESLEPTRVVPTQVIFHIVFIKIIVDSVLKLAPEVVLALCCTSELSTA